jgi:hypothetical protein
VRLNKILYSHALCSTGVRTLVLVLSVLYVCTERRCVCGPYGNALLHYCTVCERRACGAVFCLCVVSGVLVTGCVGDSCCSFQGFTCRRGVLFGVAFGLSDPSRGTRLLWKMGGWGVVWVHLFYCWGFSRASKILLGDMLCSSFRWLCLRNSE